METVQVTTIPKAETLEALNRSEIDIQISTAKKYPRDVATSLNKIVSLATINEGTAEECFYSLRRKGANGTESVINGPSIRLAEIVAASWGNLRVQAQVIGNDGKFITARGICHDLETNFAASVEVQRRICDKYGKPFSDDMQVVTGNAAAAIAFRNAVFKVVPMSVFSNAVERIKGTAGTDCNLSETRQKMLKYFASINVTEPMILWYLDIKSVEEITAEMVTELRGVRQAIKDKMSTPEELFIHPYNASVKSAEKSASTKLTTDKVKAAMAKQNTPAAEQSNNDMPLGLM